MGLVAVDGAADVGTRCWDAIEDDPTLEIVVDVEHRRVAAPAIGLDEPFELDDFTQYRLLERPRRHRPHAAARGRDHRLRDPAPAGSLPPGSVDQLPLIRGQRQTAP